MNKFSPKKLLNSKWTAINPNSKERHFIVTDVEVDESGNVIACTIEAVISRRPVSIAWRDLKDTSLWAQGWKQ
jgi:tryptophan-rich hypothetical protein